MMNYQQAMAFLEETKQYGSQLGLTSIQNLMKHLGNIQDQIPVVHVAGTNGKGSVGAMLSAVLTKAGYRTGHFSTPDVFSYEEEFRINGIPIEKTRLSELFSKIAEVCQKMTESGLAHPTRFEVETAAAFLWFWQENVDIAIVEVGMGGATDATNVIKSPLLSILTPISMDHTGFLGNTLAEIAQVKSGIIKAHCPVVSASQKKEAFDVIASKAEAEEAKLVLADPVRAKHVRILDGHICFDWQFVDENEVWTDLTLGLFGLFQVENAGCVLEACRILKNRYPLLTEETVRAGLKEAKWPGRMERIGQSPDIYLDGAHNEDAVKKLRTTLDELFTDRRIIYIMGVFADKDYETMIRLMFRPGDRVFTLTSQNPRALSGETLAEILKEQKIDASYCANEQDAVLCALQESGEEDIILAFGSLSYLKEIRQAYEKINRNR
jgi:dihydrofolate synthase/folylpolyglutamate synthase